MEPELTEPANQGPAIQPGGCVLDDPSKLEDARQAFFSAGAGAFGVAVGITLIVSLLGILYMTIVIAPNLTQRFSSALRERNILSFLAGLPVFAGFLGLGALAGHCCRPLGGLVALVFLVTLILGYAAAAEDIGRRLFWACGKEGSRATHLASGWLVFAFGSLFPLIGWFLIFPYVSISGMGALLVGTIRGRRAREVEYMKE